MKKNKVNERSSQDKKEPFFSMTLKGIFGWACAFFFVAGWMFVLGVFVGRDTAPVQFDIKNLEKELAALKEAFIKREQKEIKSASGSLNQKPVLDFYEALKDTRDFMSNEKKIKNHDKKPLPMQVVSEDINKSTAAKLSLKTVAANHPKNNNGITIQVAAVKDVKAADQFVEKLRKKGYPAYTAIRKVSEKKTWYRIRVGHYEKRDDAIDTLNRLKKEEMKSAFLVNE